jgi:hypothetical protein
VALQLRDVAGPNERDPHPAISEAQTRSLYGSSSGGLRTSAGNGTQIGPCILLENAVNIGENTVKASFSATVG